MSIGSDLAAIQWRIAAIAGDTIPDTPANPAFEASSQPAQRFTALVAANAFDTPRVGSAGHAAAAAPGDVGELIDGSATAAGVDPALVRAVAAAESGFDPTARSRAGAVGLMQLMPATARALGVQNPYDPTQNVRGGALYLHELLDRFGGDIPSAVAAYNAGPGAVEHYAGIPPYAETTAYVARVMDLYGSNRVR